MQRQIYRWLVIKKAEYTNLCLLINNYSTQIKVL